MLYRLIKELEQLQLEIMLDLEIKELEIAIGISAEYGNQGVNAIAIGQAAGQTSHHQIVSL